MWYKAYTFPTQEVARSLWKRVQSSLITENIDITTFSIIYAGKWYVVCLSEVTPTLPIQHKISQLLTSGTPASLPQQTIMQLLERRLERTQHASRSAGSPSLVYEGHTPTPMDTNSNLSPEETEIHMREVVKSLSEQRYPFIEIYRLYVGYHIGIFQQNELAHNEVLKQYQHSLDASEKYLFTDTARSMHKAVYEAGNTQWVPITSDMWIEQDTSQPFTSRGVSVKAVHILEVPQHDLIRVEGYSRKVWVINVISSTTSHIISFTYQEGSTPEFLPTLDYLCPYGKCENLIQTQESYEVLYRKPCEQCERDCIMWASWLHTAMRMIRRDYAVSSSPKPFETRSIKYSEKKLVPRHHGTGSPKWKNIENSIPYTIVSYDVSLTPASQTPEELEETGTHETRQNWLTLHGKDDIIYVARSIPDYQRRYPVRRNGTRLEGKVSVTTPLPKYVPMLRSDRRKSQTIKRVTAKKFTSEKE